MKVDRALSLAELEGGPWTEAPEITAPLARRCAELWRLPVGEFALEDLRLMIRQGVGLGFLVPVALEVLHGDPLASGDRYRGDLLDAVGRVPHGFWLTHPDLRRTFERIQHRAFAAELGD